MRYLVTLLLSTLSVNAVGQVPDYVPSDGLEAWWPFNGNATDESPNGHDGVVNGAVLTPDRFGITDNAYFFVGSNITVDILFDEPERSFFAWFNSEGPTGTNQIVFLNDHQQLNNGHSAIAFNNQTLVLQAGTVPCGNQALDYNTWYHAGAVRSSESTMYYFNGDLLCTMPNENIYSSLGTFIKLIIGSTHNDRFFFGEIDDVGIWNRALSEEEIQALYLADPPLSGCTDEVADNYNSEANVEDGTCEYLGCTNPSAENYDSTASIDDGSCIIIGCIDADAANYNSEANQDDASCLYDIDYVNDTFNDGANSVECPPCDNDCPGDYTGDGSVTVGDILAFLILYGNQCE